MLALIDDWGNPSPTGLGTEWFGFAALFLKNSQIEIMRQLYLDICRRQNSRPDWGIGLKDLVPC